MGQARRNSRLEPQVARPEHVLFWSFRRATEDRLSDLYLYLYESTRPHLRRLYSTMSYEWRLRCLMRVARR